MSTKGEILKNTKDYIFVNPIDDFQLNESFFQLKDSDSLKTFGDFKVFGKSKDILFRNINYKIRNSLNTKFKVLQKWEGIVESFDGEVLQVKLVDLTNGGTDEEAELYVEDINQDDISLIKEGAMFYWNIGYETQKDGQIKKSSFVKFKRLPKINPNEFDIIHDRAKEIEAKIVFD